MAFQYGESLLWFACRDVTSAFDRVRMREHVTRVINTTSLNDPDMQIFITADAGIQ